MQELWSSASWQPSWLSLAFAFAPVAMSIVIAYALVIRGAQTLRAWLLLHFSTIFPYALCMAISPSLSSAAAADAAFRFAAACIPLAATAGAAFQFGLLGARTARTRWIIRIGLVASAAWVVVGATTDAVISGVRWLPAGLWYAEAGPWAWLALVTTFAITAPGFYAMARAALAPAATAERRQVRAILVANALTYCGLTDAVLAYGIGVFPLGWLLSGIGSLLVVRALVVEDVLRARAFDTTAPRIVLHLAIAVLLGAATLALVGDGMAWWGATVALALCFAGTRVLIAVIGLVQRGSQREGTLERLLGQLVSRSRALRDPAAVAQLAIDVVELGIGVRVEILLAAADDWGWTTAAGARLSDDAAPDPLLVGWLAERAEPTFAYELAAAPGDLRELLARLHDRAAARAIIPVASRDELLALLAVPAAAPPIRGRAIDFLLQTAARLGEALVHVRMAKRAADHAALAREVELAAAVQQQLLPGKQPHVHGDVTVVGSWQPATRCAGDFWGVYPLDAASGRVLVAIGDVTGHGVASATVTAAAAAACDVVVRRHGGALALDQLVAALDAAVRRVAGGELAMTCFAAILDPTARELRFVSCGHTTPYLCRAGEADLELVALVGRGNPLGGGGATTAKIQHKPLRAGDLVVWYTDGVVDAQDPAGEAFGDRRLQRLLRRLDRAHLAPAAVHAVVHAGVAAHRAGRARADDETIVVAQWRPPVPASVEPAQEMSG